MKSRRIAVVTVLLMAACVLMLSVVLGSADGTGTWALPAFLAAIAVIATVGGVLMWRARSR